eukprot:TRINITY_DN3130_c0_g1_i2.p1 TRINITY_DN3130_c0_g1~~TRINITY_DN3130_c0_g1_i2.p1  ORF type:complete len:504 (+),score=155.02 TRINITY_DN3130_c0_g1_i2:1431-2942(+)
MSNILKPFTTYQNARNTFIQTVAELASRPQNVEPLIEADVMNIVKPFLQDPVATIQQTAAVAVGRLANHSDSVAEAIVANGILPQLVHSLKDQSKHFKKAAAFVLKSVARHSPTLAAAVVDSDSVPALVACLEEFDPGVKESATWALGHIARHNEDLARVVVDAGAVSLLVFTLQEPELSLKCAAAACLADIAKHNAELAQYIVDAGAVAYLAPLMTNTDVKLKRQVCSCLSQISKHSFRLAEIVTEQGIFPRVLLLLKDVDAFVKRNACTLVREVVKHTPELAQMVINHGGAVALVEYINETNGHARLPGIMAVGYIAAFSETLALSLITANIVPALADVLVQEEEDHILAGAVWTVSQLGRHTPEHANAIASMNLFPKLSELLVSPSSSEDLQLKCKRALKAVVSKCMDLEALDPLLHTAPEEVLKTIVGQYAKILPNNVEARKAFVVSGGLQRLQMLEPETGSRLQEFVDIINGCYPNDVVQYYSPNYMDTLLEQIDKTN